ncbi:MAG TPA: 30S ribosomal protein S12 methylthiotransferase RimO [Patescibacteria group bacterium]|nr:30S ribosomal protein S12 methylthiotransferase RimO [Patescibacteria group bacterium]
MLKAGFVSLGCAKNLVDTEVMLGILAANRVALTNEPVEADVIIVNTCGFIDSAKEESISTVLQMAEYMRTGKCRGIILAGCLGERYRQELLDELPEVAAIVGTGAWHRIMEAVNAVLAGERVLLVDDQTTLYDDTMPRVRTTPFYSAYVKVAEGCSNCCTYCVIPAVRGAFRSRTHESVLAEVKQLVAGGVREINLIAQDTTSYGRDLTGAPQLAVLLRDLVAIEGTFWIRLLYCYPRYFSDEIIELMATEEKICKYVDLPLQHIHADILQAMNRKDSPEDIRSLLAKIRQRIPGVAIRTSLIVGFPAETEEQFTVLKDFVLQQQFEHLGVFTYSQEEGTVAGAMENQISAETKEQRYHDLMALQCKVSEDANRCLEGQELTVLIEGRNEEQPEVMFGRSYREAPDVDGRVYVERAADAQPGDWVKVKVLQGFTYDLLTEKVEQQS